MLNTSTSEAFPEPGTSKVEEARSSEASEIVIPLLAEEVSVQKTVVPTGTVRVQKIVHESNQIVSEPLAAETVEIERIPKNLMIDSAPSIRTEGDVTIIPIVEEVLVVTKQLRLVEEVRVITRRSVVAHQQAVSLRAEELIVERSASQKP